MGNHPLKKPLFELGQTVATPGALEALQQAGVSAVSLLCRHQCGDWGDLEDEDSAANNQALTTGARLLSAYIIQDVKFWVITEAEDDEGHRLATTILLPEEY